MALALVAVAVIVAAVEIVLRMSHDRHEDSPAPVLSALAAQRLYRRVLYGVAPTLVATGITWQRTEDLSGAAFMLVAVGLTTAVLRAHRHPLHLAPIARYAYNAFVPAAGVVVAVSPGIFGQSPVPFRTGGRGRDRRRPDHGHGVVLREPVRERQAHLAGGGGFAGLRREAGLGARVHGHPQPSGDRLHRRRAAHRRRPGPLAGRAQRRARRGAGRGHRPARGRAPQRPPEGLRAGRARLPGPAGANDRGHRPVRGRARSRAHRHDQLGLVPVHHAPALLPVLAAVQAVPGHHRVGADAGRGGAVPGPGRAGGQARGSGPDLLPPAARGRGGRGVRHAQVPHPARRRRRSVGDALGGRDDHQGRAGAAQDPLQRAPAAGPGPAGRR